MMYMHADSCMRMNENIQTLNLQVELQMKHSASLMIMGTACSLYTRWSFRSINFQPSVSPFLYGASTAAQMRSQIGPPWTRGHTEAMQTPGSGAACISAHAYLRELHNMLGRSALEKSCSETLQTRVAAGWSRQLVTNAYEIRTVAQCTRAVKSTTPARSQ